MLVVVVRLGVVVRRGKKAVGRAFRFEPALGNSDWPKSRFQFSSRGVVVGHSCPPSRAILRDALRYTGYGCVSVYVRERFSVLVLCVLCCVLCAFGPC